MVRIVGEVRYESSGLGREKIWFEVPDKFAASLSTSGNSWVACLTLLAATLHEDLVIHTPIDKTLFENLPELLSIWKCWYPTLSIPTVHAEPVLDERGDRQNKASAFFSGGVDSFFTVLHLDQGSDPDTSSKLDDLLCVWGFDIPLSKPESFERMRRSLAVAATRLD